jgi:hypothetical protein
MESSDLLTEKHNYFNEAVFFIKSYLLSGKRNIKNIYSGIKRFQDEGNLKDAPIIAVSESNLWNPDDNDQNWILTAGKIQNLRIAAANLNGIEVDAGEIFSFWKHIGRPVRSRGYVTGREIREGCIVPTIAGGLCQLSNALYDAALSAGFDIIERHRHTRVIRGSLAEKNRDATVKWSYIDLRFRSHYSFRIIIEFTPDKLIVKFAARQSTEIDLNEGPLLKSFDAAKINDCYSCGNYSCSRNPGIIPDLKKKAITTFILDERWPETEAYVQSLCRDDDFFLVPFLKSAKVKINRLSWSAVNNNRNKTFAAYALRRAISTRIYAKTGGNIFRFSLQQDAELASAMMKYVPVETTHIVISQNLLPWFWKNGMLWGRTFDVVMTRLPLKNMHDCLNEASAKYPESKTLADFRASQELVEAEKEALSKARWIISPHQQISEIYSGKIKKLTWAIDIQQVPVAPVLRGKKILFPGPGLARKGAYEVRRLALELDLTVVILSTSKESAGFWEGVKTEIAGPEIFEGVSCIVYPAYVENQPRFILKAASRGIPVVTTTAAGINPSDIISVVATGDYEALKGEVGRILGGNINHKG